MTQGYGPDDAQQPQWGQGSPGDPYGQQPQQPAPEPQWGQASPAAAQQPAQEPQWNPSPDLTSYPGTPQTPGAQQYPGASQYPGAPQYPGAQQHPGATQHPGVTGSASATGTGVDPTLAKVAQWTMIAVIVVIVVRVIRGAVGFGAGFVSGAMSSGGAVDGGMAVAGGGALLGLLLLLLNGVVTLGLLVLAIFVAVKSSGRARTGAIIIAATLVLSVVLYGIGYGIYVAVIYNMADYSTIGVVAIIYAIVEVIRSLIVFAALIVGGLMVRRGVKQGA
ncbi:hypothetical protein [Brachybacterium sp. 107]|uniref:hypothetical protein n=1 Tax=Brachybacterium sp. 107 TaxID=3457736 RepID=UPI0040339531